MNNANLTIAPPKPLSALTGFKNIEMEPSRVLNFAHQAAKALTDVIRTKSKQTIINGEQYLSFEDWQTIGRFYNTTVGVEWTKPILKDNKTFGFEAKAVAYKDGTIISSAEASCLREESNWKDKPSFQVKSMAQTRASAKCLRNVFAWVVVLAGFKPTPAEEMEQVSTITEIAETSSSPSWQERDGQNWNENLITDKQSNLLRNLIIEKVADEAEREEQLSGISTLSKSEASTAISALLNQY